MTMTLNSRAVSRIALPEQPEGMIIGERRSPWAVIVPEASRNLLTNPSFELNTTSWAIDEDGSSTLGRNTSPTWLGGGSGGFLRSGGTYAYIYSDAVTVIAGESVYTFSAYLYRLYSVSVSLEIYEYDNAMALIRSTSRMDPSNLASTWHRSFVTTPITGSTVYLRAAVRLNTDGVCWIDALQLEPKPYVTTYIDGDQEGCYWAGAPHASQSARYATDRTGGRVWNFRDFKFWTTALIGTGAAALTTVITPYALIGGGNYQRSIAPPRAFSIVGAFDCVSDIDLKRNRQNMINALAPYAVGEDQPARLIYTPVGCDEDTGNSILIDAVYSGGLEGNWTNDTGIERAALSFTSYLPLAILGKSEFEKSALLTPYEAFPSSLSDVYLQRNRITGDWVDITGSFNTRSLDFVSDRRGGIYAVGQFTSPGNFAAYWNGLVWAALGSGGDAEIASGAMTANGYLNVVGSFTGLGGTATQNGVGRWNGTTWADLGGPVGVTGGGGIGLAIAVAPNDDIYIGGNFTSIEAVAANNIAYWDASALTWNALGVGTNGAVTALAIDREGKVYVGGNFTSAGGITTNSIARWNPTTAAWEDIGGTSAATPINDMTMTPDGHVYLSGAFTSVGGVTALLLARYNGSSWSAVDIASGSSAITKLGVLGNGNLQAVGFFTAASSGMAVSGAAEWNGSVWVPSHIYLAGVSASADIPALVSDDRFEYYDARAATDVLGSASNVITVTGSQASPVLRLTGPGHVFRLDNLSNNTAVYFNLELVAGEIATLKFGNNPTFISNIRGDITNTILPGSQTASFRLQHGTNYVTLLHWEYTSDAESMLFWHEQYDSLDGAAIVP